MTNLLIAYSVAFLVIFAFAWLLTSRQRRIEKKLDDLKEQIREKR